MPFLLINKGIAVNWTTESTPSGQICHKRDCAVAEADLRTEVMAAADYAFSFLNESILDDSMFCLFDWQPENTTLSITVTDQSKSNDGKHQIVMTCQGLAPSETLTEDVKYWIKDHLTTSLEFLRFSLIAGFTRGSREKVELL